MDYGSESTIVDCKNVCPPEEKPDMINHPRHYCREGAIECIDEIELIFGPEVTMHFCLGNVFKYRYRAGLKNNGYEDLEKSDWYMRKYKELKEKVDKNHQGSLTIGADKITVSPFISAVPCNTK
jgi:hypothetical protein